ALGCFRRKELAIGASQWVATEGQFLRLPGGVAKSWLQQRHETTETNVAATRTKLKVKTQDLLREHPDATSLHPGVCQLLLQEQRVSGAPQRREEEERQERETGKEVLAKQRAAAEERQAKRKTNTLDYSRFDHIASSDSEDNDG
ncbi:unnamed protein product, partial [Polarella glacialis]